MKKVAAHFGHAAVQLANGDILGSTDPLKQAGLPGFGTSGLKSADLVKQTMTSMLGTIQTTTPKMTDTNTKAWTLMQVTSQQQLQKMNDVSKTQFGTTQQQVTDTMKTVGDTMAVGAEFAGQRFVQGLVDKEAPLQATMAKYSSDILAAARAFLTTIGAPVPFASGGVEDHSPAIHNKMRLFAEPETGGEAYIPLGVGKRPQSEKLLTTVAKMFGMGITKMAAG